MSVRIFLVIVLPAILGTLIIILLMRVCCRKQFLAICPVDPCQCLEKDMVVVQTVEVPVPIYITYENTKENNMKENKKVSFGSETNV
jgi:hypothetical protein